MRARNWSLLGVKIAADFARRGDLRKALVVVDILVGDSVDWARWHVFKEYLDSYSLERAETSFERHQVLIKPESKVEALPDIARCAGKENSKLARDALILALQRARHIKGRSNRDWRLEMVINTACDLEEWDIVAEACRAMSGKGRRKVIEDRLFPEELEKGVTTCWEFAETLKRRYESAEENSLDLVIETHLKYEKEILKSRVVHPYLYKLKAVKIEEGVTFYAVRRPLTVALTWYLLDRVMRLLSLNAPHEEGP